MPRPRIHKEGQRFGRLMITKAYYLKISSRWHHMVLCDCGNIRLADGAEMRRGGVSSCGCLRKESRETHKLTKSSEYKAWSSMIQRCNNKKASAYKNYGGRGITVCKKWLLFEGFIEDMGMKASDGLTIERVDNDKGYSKSNCVWADRYAQNQNQRVRRDNKTGHVGVSIDHRYNTYTATLQRNKKRVFLGRFSDLNEAIAARMAAEEQFNQTRGI